MKDIMIDLETMGTTPNSVIVQIGACYFDRISGKTGCEFLMNVSMKSCMDLGLTMDASTVEWWLNKTNRSFLQQPIHDVKEVFDYLFNFCNKCKCVWAHATFDFPILMNAYNKINYNLPFSFRDCRDLRTLVDLAGIPYKNTMHWTTVFIR